MHCAFIATEEANWGDLIAESRDDEDFDELDDECPLGGCDHEGCAACGQEVVA